MARYRLKLDKFDWYEIDADTDSTTGKRVYHTPDGPANSVTTILGSLPNPELDEWRERVGEEEANRISKEATDIGTLMHDHLEALLLKKEFIPNPDCNPDEHLKMAKQMSKAIQWYGWRKMREVWAVEIPLHFGDLYAGRTDLVGVYDGKPAIMDYKTSKFIKMPEHLKKYRLQMAAYALAMEKMFGQRFECGVNFFALRPNPEFNKAAESHVVEMDAEMMLEYKVQWIEILMDYYDGDIGKLEQIEEMVQMVNS